MILIKCQFRYCEVHTSGIIWPLIQTAKVRKVKQISQLQLSGRKQPLRRVLIILCHMENSSLKRTHRDPHRKKKLQLFYLVESKIALLHCREKEEGMRMWAEKGHELMMSRIKESRLQGLMKLVKFGFYSKDERFKCHKTIQDEQK